MAAEASTPHRRAQTARTTEAGADRASFRQRYLAVLFKSRQASPLGAGPTPVPPLPGRAHGGATVDQTLASVAYRELPLGSFPGAAQRADAKPPLGLLRPSLGEAYARTVVERMLGRGTGVVIQSFGMSPRGVVEHCLESLSQRRRRDVCLLIVSLLFGWFFLPGTALWLAALRLRSVMRADPAALRAVPAGAVVACALWLAVHGLPVGGWLSWYSRFVLLAPPAGWFLAKDLALRSAVGLRVRLVEVLDSDPASEGMQSAPRRRRARRSAALESLDAEQASNILFRDGTAGVLGLGRRWGSWELTESVTVHRGGRLPAFKAGQIIDQVIENLLDRQKHGAGAAELAGALVNNWVIVDTSGRTGRIQRPAGRGVEGFSLSAAEVIRVKESAAPSHDRRHRLGVQFSLHAGQLVLTLLVSATVVDAELTVTVEARALGSPLAQMIAPPASHWNQASTVTRFRESEVPWLAGETLRLLARAHFVCAPALLERLGGTLAVPEPFGLRHVWANPAFSEGLQAVDALRIVTPVLSTIHGAVLEVMESHGVDTSRFVSRAASLATPDGLLSSSAGKAPS